MDEIEEIDQEASKHVQEVRYIIKRIKKKGHGKHHGGGWKIAYADFVTAMMAFFLLMWLLSMLNKYQLDGISNYFRHPLKDAFTQQDSSTKRDTVKAFKHIDQIAMDNMEKVKSSIEDDLNKSPEMSQYKNLLNFVITSDGLKIELRDLEKQSMFSQGKTDFKEHAKKILSWLSGEINHYPNRVVILGHTDSLPYGDKQNYGNWELSADRANATRRALVEAGMDKQKIIRVIGVADVVLLDKANAFDASNRRIEIVVLTDKASKRLLSDY